jgi:RNAse (barnase) inhibitor barstar
VSGLTRLTGVRRTTSGTVDSYESDAEELGWRCIVLDGSEVEDKDAFLDLCSDAFGLPEWFGMNWDALDECLADLDHDGAEGVVVLWTNWSELADAARQDFATAMDVLASAVRGWAVEGVRGGVLLLGEGPDLDVEQL